jgi:hypothetical protein
MELVVAGAMPPFVPLPLGTGLKVLEVEVSRVSVPASELELGE